MPRNRGPIDYRVAVIGLSGVGKSSFVIQYLTHSFPTEPLDPTVEETYRKVETIDGESCLMNILDSSGQEEYASMRCSFMRCSQGFLCVYDVTSRHSLEELETFIQQFLLISRQERYPMVVVQQK